MKIFFLAAALLCLGLPAMPATAGLPFVQDRYPEALALARQRKVPLFVEVWAPW